MTVSASSNPPKKNNPYFFTRDSDGTVRVRLRFTAEEAAQMEEAAGDMAVVSWIHQTLSDAAEEQVAWQRAQRPQVGPPR